MTDEVVIDDTKPLYFVCSRCEYPICGKTDILTTPVEGGVTDSAFRYDLDFMLDLDTPVPCYSLIEGVDTAVNVSEELLQVPLPPAAHLMALESILESRKFILEQKKKTQERLRQELGNNTAPGATTATSGQENSTAVNHEHDRQFAESIPEAPMPSINERRTNEDAFHPIRRYGSSSEKRIDLICINTEVLGNGLEISSKDRSAIGVPAPKAEGDNETSEGTTSGTNQRGNDLNDVPQEILDVAAQPSSSTQWLRPGNLSVRESYMTVTRTTMSAYFPWFKDYVCAYRVECADCHLPLGFLFENRRNHSSTTDASEFDIQYEKTPQSRPEEARPEGEEEGGKKEEDHSPHRAFIGLELKQITQRNWGLREFQERYKKSQSLNTFKALFPEAEELQSLYSRLSALRTQAELYSNLLRKHKEQNDVQSALLQSQKHRMATYEEKLLTMRQIIDAQRLQLDMQTKQIKNQDELLRSHRNQLDAQQRQMEVEQLLLHEQKKTMKVQRHQLLLMRDRLADGGEEEGTAVAEGGEPARRDSDPHWESARVRPDDGVSVPATEPPAHLRAVYARMRQEPFDTDDQYASLYMQPSTAVNREAPPASEKSDNEQNNDSNHPSNEENENATESANREEVP